MLGYPRWTVEIDKRCFSRRLDVAIGHADDDALVKAENIPKFFREILEERQRG